MDDLQLVFDNLVDVTEPICQAIDSAKADMTIFDSSGIEAFVTENNPKYANRIIKQLKAYAKTQGFDKSYDPYKAAYGSMPSHASANPEIKQLYINGHFCYVFKFGIVTNGLGIIRHISFYNKDFFSKHPLINPKTFLGDAAFDTSQLYKSLLVGSTFGDDKHFSKAYIPLNARAGLENQDYSINKNGIPCCPHDPSLPMKYECTSKLRSGVTRFKFVCPKMKYVYDKNTKKVHRQCCCENPCTTSRCGEWSTSTRKRIFVLIPERSAEPKNGITLIKSGLLSKEISITSKIISVLQDAGLKMRRPCMLI